MRAQEEEFGHRWFPKVVATYDFNIISSNDNASGPRFEILGRNRLFGYNYSNDKIEWYPEKAFGYALGLGIGSYKAESLKEEGEDDYLNHAFLMFVITYQNQNSIEPFLGIYPGITWGPVKELFANPVAGINVPAFKLRRNWNSYYLKTYFQLRIEYNTILSTTFLSAGLLLEFQ